MSREHKIRILTLIPRGDRANRLTSFLARSQIEVRSAETGQEALLLLSSERFDLAAASLPIPDISVGRLVTEVRSLERPTSLILVAKSPQLEAARVFESQMVQVVGFSESDEALHHVLADALGIATRLSVRIPIRLEVEVEASPTFRFCETRDLSSSGMLISSSRPLPLGSTFSFELMLPHSLDPLTGIAEVVRYSDPRVEDTTGFGARFLDLATSEGARIDHFIRDENRTN